MGSHLALRPEVRAVADDLIAIRRDLHQHPELSWKEHRTRDVIIRHLTGLGLTDVRPIAETGVTALLPGKFRSPALLWRADIDALPVPEKTGLSYASTIPNAMHACGHDAHVAIALGLARILAARKSSLKSPVRFVFQPAEEAEGGAEACLADGILDAPRVQRVLGLHVSADLPLGDLNIAPGPFFASPTFIRIEIKGRGGHAAAPHQTVDSVVVAAHLITALQTVVSRSLPPSESAVLTIGKLTAGYRSNVIAESASLSGTIRSYTDTARDLLIGRTQEIIAGICAAFGAEYTFRHTSGCPAVVNDPDVTAWVRSRAASYFGPAHLHNAPSMGADDISVFLRERPGAYFWLGARNEAQGIAGRHHDSGFVIDEAAIAVGVEFALQLVEDYAG